MPGSIETIRSYLVSLGFSVNESDYTKVEQALNKVQRTIERTTKGWTHKIAEAGGLYIGVLASMAAATAGLGDVLERADTGYQLFALHMRMGTQEAKQFQIALNTMGQSIEDIAWNRMLRGRFGALIGWEQQIGTPAGWSGTIGKLHELKTEWDKFRISVWKFWEFLGSALDRFGVWDKLMSAVRWLNQEFLKYKEVIAGKLGWFLAQGVYQIGQLITGVQTLFRWLQHGFHYLREEVWGHLNPQAQHRAKEIGLIGAVLFGAYEAWQHPVLAMAAAFSALTEYSHALAQDYRNWSKGQASNPYLAYLWKFAQVFSKGGAENWGHYFHRIASFALYWLGYLWGAIKGLATQLRNWVVNAAIPIGENLARGLTQGFDTEFNRWIKNMPGWEKWMLGIPQLKAVYGAGEAVYKAISPSLDNAIKAWHQHSLHGPLPESGITFSRPNTLAQRLNNPGNLKFAFQAGATPGPHGFAHFQTLQQGWQALLHQISLDSERGETLKQFIYKYAPTNENNTAAYLRNLELATGAHSGTPLRMIDPTALAAAVAKHESGAIVRHPIPKPLVINHNEHITVKTQATDPDEVARKVHHELKKKQDSDMSRALREMQFIYG